MLVGRARAEGYPCNSFPAGKTDDATMEGGYMLGLTNGLRADARERTIVALAIATILGLLLLTPTAAHASGCTDSWTNASGGNWFTPTNWSTGKAPGSEDEACITASGTYTVTMTQTNTTGTVSVRSLTVGGTSGTQTLAVGSSCTLNAILNTTSGISNGAQGAIALTNGEGCATSVTLTSSVTNAGAFSSELAIGGSRTLQGNFVNTGTLGVNTNTAFSGASALLTNEGTIGVAEAKTLTASGGASVTNGAGGKINATGSGDVLETAGTFTEGAGTTSGTKPVIVDDGTLTYSASGGSSLIALRGSSSLTGTSSAGQSLFLESTCSENAVVTAGSGFVNGGTTTLTNGDGCSNNVTLVVAGTGLSNSGTLTSETNHGGSRQIQATIKNTGKIAINSATAYNGTDTLLTNEGAIEVAEGKQLTVGSKVSLTNGTGGSIAATGNGNVFVASGGAFTQGVGTTSGSEPVIVDDGALNYTGAGASVISARGSTALTGNLSAGQSLAVQSTCSEHAVTSAAASYTNGGTITLTNGDGCSNNATLATTAGTLTNSGKIAVEFVHGGSRTIQGNLTNTGTLAINFNTAYNSVGAALINEGTVEIAESRQLTVSGGSFTNGAGGTISAGAGADILMNASTFNQGAGTTSGTKPVIVDDGTLNYTGVGASQIALRGSTALSGNLSAGQSLSVQSTCSEHATATAAVGYTNGGTITLTNGDGCSNNATLATTAGTLTNSGKIAVEFVHGGSRTIAGNLTNTGTLEINASTGFPTSGASLLNEGTIAIAGGGVTLSATGGGTVTNGPGGTIAAAGNGALTETGGTFDQGTGGTTGSLPIILDDLTLNYTEHGSGKIALRGSSTVNGAVKNNEILLIESTCSEHATATAAGSFTNNGIIELTNGDGCANNATLNMNGGTLTNSNTITAGNPHGGVRAIQGNVINNQMVSVAAGETLQISGTYTQASAGKFRSFIASASSFGVLSVSGTATIAGTLITHDVSPFKGALGQKYAVLGASSLTGTFAAESEDQINYTGLYYKPTYSATGVTLVVSQATQVRSPKSGLPGSVVTVTGSGYVSGDTITPTFTDHNGEKTTYPTVTVNGGGEFSVELTIPPAAALGTGTITVTSTLTGVHISQNYTVT
jgi:hypothetical protein